jgi:hypothetical protein
LKQLRLDVVTWKRLSTKYVLLLSHDVCLTVIRDPMQAAAEEVAIACHVLPWLQSACRLENMLLSTMLLSNCELR